MFYFFPCCVIGVIINYQAEFSTSRHGGIRLPMGHILLFFFVKTTNRKYKTLAGPAHAHQHRSAGVANHVLSLFVCQTRRVAVLYFQDHVIFLQFSEHRCTGRHLCTRVHKLFTIYVLSVTA